MMAKKKQRPGKVRPMETVFISSVPKAHTGLKEVPYISMDGVRQNHCEYSLTTR